MLKIIIAGGRDFKDIRLMDQVLQDNTQGMKPQAVQIISGGARGADKLGEQLAIEHGCNRAIFPAQWGDYGNSAGYIRNILMAENADALLAFWDGQSKGTANMIDIATKRGLKVVVTQY